MHDRLVSEHVNNAVKKLNEIQYRAVQPSYDTKLGLNIIEDSVDRSHRLGRWHSFTFQSQTEFETPKPKAIIVKFMNYHDRSDVFRSKAKLKQTGIAIYET